MEFGECIDEAAEQAGLDPAALTHRHLNSMTRSLDLVMIEIENEGAKPEYRMETSTFTINAGDGVIVLPEDTVDVTEVVISSGDSDLGMTRAHRDDSGVVFHCAPQGSLAASAVGRRKETRGNRIGAVAGPDGHPVR